jgi:thiol-disulfide isomerase/thioredoxin
MNRRFFLAILCLATVFSTRAAADTEWKFQSIDGKEIAPFADESGKLLVAVFVTTDCPVANYFQPTLRRLGEKYAERGVTLVLFHSDPAVDREKAATHAEEYGIEAPVVLDPDFEVAKRLDAEVTPEAFVITRAGEVTYRGRINDMYADFGKKRRAPRNNDLDDAITAALEGREVSAPRTKPIGCYIPYPKVTPPSK